MITLLKSGLYKLTETRHGHKILQLGHTEFAWITLTGIGDVLVATTGDHEAYAVLGLGDYRLYSVKDEPYLSDHMHLELETGKEEWQGYLLLTGLPDDEKKRARIIPTKEVISDNPIYAKRRIESPMRTSHIWKI